MRRTRSRPEILTLWVAGLGLLSVGVCCLGIPGVSSGWNAACHSGGGAGHCSPQSATGCLMAHLASRGQASDAEPAADTVTQPTQVAVASIPTESVAPAGVSATGPSGQTHLRDGTTAVFLLHSSFLL